MTLNPGQKLALVAAVSVIVIGTYFVIMFPGRPDYPEPPADVDPEIRERMLAVRERAMESASIWDVPRVRMMPTVAGGFLALAGGLLGSPALLVIGFAVGFLPFKMGLYLLLVGWHATWVGLCELLYLVAAAMMVRHSPGSTSR